MRFLVVNGERSSSWGATLGLVLDPLGAVDRVTEQDAVSKALKERYILIVVDATVTKYPKSLVGRLRAQCPEARIVVITEPCNWKAVRDAFHAGATDSIERLVDEEKIRSTVQRALAL